jgi:hypothetical protein
VHHRAVEGIAELHERLERAFAASSRGLARWADPHPDRSTMPDEAYSRVTNAERWHILAARTEAWITALVDTGLATVERDASPRWSAHPLPLVHHAERIVPTTPGALELVVAHSRIGDVMDAGIVLGVGEPAECIVWIPDCGCDACDSGSANELDHLDVHVRGVVTGTFRRLTDGARTITVIGDDVRMTSGFAPRADAAIDAALADPTGWDELSGASWLDALGAAGAPPDVC